MPTCHVALPIPSRQPYSYEIPTALADRVAPGSRVVVPVRGRELVGIVLGIDEAPRDGLKPILLAPDDEPLVPAPLLELGRWIAEYYVTPLGLTFRAMVPPALWGASRLVARLLDAGAVPGGASKEVVQLLRRAGGRATAASLTRRLRRPAWDALQRLARLGAVELSTEPPRLGPSPRRERVLILTRSLPSLLERDRAFGRAARQRAVYEALDALGGEATASHLRDQLGFSPALLKGLVERGLARIEERERMRDPFEQVRGTSPPVPSEVQRSAIAGIRARPHGAAVTLFGVTGSGKTLVYLESLRDDVDRGRGVIVLVPEIALTPQTIGRVMGAFGDGVAVLHSGLSEAERADAWRAVASGHRRIVIGARSAVFAPIADLAAIVVDEEHDASYKHGEAPRYHARDVALRRAALQRARAVLASATPSLETWARDGAVTVSLPQRVGTRPLPPVSLVDMRSEPQVRESGAVPWSDRLDGAVQRALSNGSQVILLLNRRGFAHFLQCSSCGEVHGCPHCSITLTLHVSPPGLRCHYCGYHSAVPSACAACGHGMHHARGLGTQQLERWLAERYPAARIARMDADTTTAKWSHGRILDAVGRREIDILFGTQMIAKGLDFPGVTVVGVVDADTGLHFPDFRSAERTFQLVAQVAGRAGRGPDGGEVFVQTRSPDHYALVSAARHDYQGFVERELAQRRQPPYPPHVSLVNVVVSGLQETQVAAAAVDVAEWLRGLVARRASGGVEVIGPAPAPLARIKRRWRWHLMFRGMDRGLVDRVARYGAARAPHTGRGAVRVVFDRDPVSVL